jgi:hypothetical protein
MGKQIQLAPKPTLPKKKSKIMAALKTIEGRGDVAGQATVVGAVRGQERGKKKKAKSSGDDEPVVMSKPRSFSGSKTNASRFAVLAETLDALDAEEEMDLQEENDEELRRLEAKALRKAARKVMESDDVDDDDDVSDDDSDAAEQRAAARRRVAPEAREEVERLLAEAGEAGADSDDDDDALSDVEGDDSDASGSDDDGHQGVVAEEEGRVGKPAAFAAALAEALTRPVPSNQPAVLSRSSAVGQAAAEERERLEGNVRSRADRRYARDQLKSLRTTLPCAVARPLAGPTERALRGVATKGVVQLFNILDKQEKAEKAAKRERAKRQNRVLGSSKSAKTTEVRKRVKKSEDGVADSVMGDGGTLTQASFLELLARKAH